MRRGDKGGVSCFLRAVGVEDDSRWEMSAPSARTEVADRAAARVENPAENAPFAHAAPRIAAAAAARNGLQSGAVVPVMVQME